MNFTIFIAQALGIIFTVAGISIFTNKKGVLSLLEETTNQRGLLWLYGFVIITIGSVILVLNNTWSSGLVSLITVIGWLCILKGFILLCFPDVSISLYKKWASSGFLKASGFLAFVLGLVLLYKGFM
jgi:hypothetical protein